MKKILFSFIGALVASSLWSIEYDVILTSSRMQMQVNIIEYDSSMVMYLNYASADQATHTLSLTDVNKIYFRDGSILSVTSSNDQVKLIQTGGLSSEFFSSKISIPTYSEQPKHEEKPILIEVPSTRQTVSEVVTSQPQETSVPLLDNHIDKVSLATVEQFNGVYVFTESKPVSEYEILGEIEFNGSGSSSFYMSGGLMLFSSGETPQYNEIRSALVTNAVLANREVEGVIITILGNGKGKATMLKFKPNQNNLGIATVNRQNGIYIFCDCTPIASYQFLGEVSCGGLDASFITLRDKLIKNTMSKHKNANGIILHMKTGKRDKAEAIKF